MHSICSCILDPPTSGITSPTPPVSFLTSPPITLPIHTLHPLASPLASYVLLQHVYHFLMLRNLHVLFFIARLPLFEHKPQGDGGVCLFFLLYNLSLTQRKYYKHTTITNSNQYCIEGQGTNEQGKRRREGRGEEKLL